jgi:hypothetical protein
LPNSDAALQEEGMNLIDYSSALAHQSLAYAGIRRKISLAKNIFQFSNLIGASRSGKVSLSVPSENRYSSPGYRWPSERSAMVRKTKAKVSKKCTQAGKKSVRRAVGKKSRKTAKTLAAKKLRERVTSRKGVSPHTRGVVSG